jgi:predicted ABC-type transport system involved in lysophospholipase L1 biosynthesis ATPase subunit
MTESSASLIRAEDVGMAYRLAGKTLPVLEGVSLSIAAGERVAIVGPSGAGKSTLLHVLGGLQNPTAGRVFIQDQDVYRTPPAARTAMRARRIGFVFQAYHLLPELDVLENVMLPSMALGRPGPGARAYGMHLLQAVGLEERWNHTPLELSGGEQQRVALARALMNDPEILFADEPTGSLDSKTGALVLQYLFALADTKGRTLVIVTHNTEVAGACMRTIRMKDGRIEDG